MLVEQRLTKEERDYIKWSFIGAFVSSIVGAAVELGKDELKRRIENNRAKKEASQ